MSTQERNIAAVHAFHEAFNRQNIDGAAAIFAEDARNHGRQVGRAGLRMVLGDIFTRFPDARLDIEDIAAIGEQVIVRATYSGTHLGIGRLPIDGGLLIGVEPTGKKFAVQHIHWFKMRDGLIAEHFANRDDVGMMVQLGLIPAPPEMGPPPA